MKTLTKIKLINWHGFYNETIDISGSVLITGENGTGKSTLLDAIYFVLTGGEEDFNSAANTNNSRTVETYMRGKTGIEGSTFLRNDKNLISHIALEYFDNNRNESFILGAVLEIQEGKTAVNRSFYHIPNAKMDEQLFVANDEYLNFQGMKKNNKDIDINELKTGGKKGIRRDIYQILEMDSSNDRYFQLLPKAMAFKPIGEHGKDVNDFVYEFLMPERNTDLEDIKTTINSYNEIRNQLTQERQKREALSKINEFGNAYEELCREKECLDILKYLLDLEKQNGIIQKCDSDEIKNQVVFEALKNKKAFYEAQAESLKDQRRQISNSEEYQSLISLRKELDALDEGLNGANKRKSDFNKDILCETNDVLNYLNLDINLSKYIKSEDYPSFKVDLVRYGRIIEEKKDDAIRENLIIENKRKDIVEKQRTLNDKKEKLSKGVFQYSPEVTSLIKIIKEEGLKNYKRDISVTPLCEMIEIKQECEIHRNAIEGYLANHRFDLFVPEQFFDFALSIYTKNKNNLKIHSVGLVKSAAIPNAAVEQDSLALMIETEDSKAQKYINYLLGNVIFTGKDYFVMNVESSVDESVFVYSNCVFRQRNPKLFGEPFIGINSIKMQLEIVNNKLNGIKTELEYLSRKEVENNILKSRLGKTRYNKLLECGNVWEQAASAQTKYDFKKKEYDAVDTNQGLTHDLTVLDNQINDIRRKISECDDENNNLIRESTNIENRRQNAQERISDLNKLLSGYYSDGLKKEMVDKYTSEHKMSSSELEKVVIENNKELERKKNTLVVKMGQYIKDYNFDAVADIDSLPVFYNELNIIVTRNLVVYEGKLEDVQKQATLIFQNSYIEEIRNNIKREKDNIDLLNKVLKERPFGSEDEVYQFVISKSKDDRFGQYYDIFTSNQNYISTNLFTETLSDKNANLMQELFERLTSDSKDANQERLVREYTDYRRFMSYDIRITNKNGKDSYFSKIYKEKSGGETQTPFYVVIAASFDQIVKGGYKTRSPGCLVMFDEAFNNMDESRIESMMQYFNQLSIQPIIAVPTARAKSIFPYVGTSVVLVKSNGRIVNIGWKNDRLSEKTN